jgi:lipid-A-disaccharide synthase
MDTPHSSASSLPSSGATPRGAAGDGPRLFIIAGDPSGDIHAANMVRALVERCPEARLAGLGGPNLKKAGVKILANIVEDLAIIGLAGVVKNFPTIRRLFLRTVNFLKTQRPDALILVDYPGFNLRMAAEAKKLGIPVIYYITPQVWAWRRGRIKTLAQVVDKMIVIFPFEEGLFRQAGMDVTYVGHPLLDLISIDMERDQVWNHFGLDTKKRLIGLVPGSRKSEIEHMLPTMLGAAERLWNKLPDVQFALPRASTISPEYLDKFISRCNVPILVADRYRYNLRSTFDFAWVTSGTATLETALLLTPLIIVYQVNWLTWLVGKRFMTLACIGLPNIVAGDIIVPELLQDEMTPQNLYERTLHYLTDAEDLDRMKAALLQVKDKLGGPGASSLAAEAVLEVLERRKTKL